MAWCCSVVLLARLSAIVVRVSSRYVGISSNSSMTIVNTRSNQSSTRSFDDANRFFRVQRGLNSKSRWNKIH